MARRERLVLVASLLLGLCGWLAVAFFRLHSPWRDSPPQPPSVPSPNGYDRFVSAGKLAVEFPRDKATADGWAVLTAAERRAWLVRNAAALAELRRGLPEPAAEPLVYDFAYNHPQYKTFRTLARVLRREAELRAEDGQWSAALDSHLDCAQFGLTLGRRAPVLPTLVGVAVDSIGRVGQPAVVDHLTAAQARAGLARLAPWLPSDPWYVETMACEQVNFLASLQRLVRSQGLSRGLSQMLTWERPWKWPANLKLLVSPTAGYFECESWLGEYQTWGARPWSAAVPPPVARGALARDLGDVYVKPRWKLLVDDTCDREWLVALALQAWRAEHGAYPERLDALVPGLLATVPADPFGTGPLRYRRAGDTYVLWSVGPDRRDDGGRAIQDRGSDGKDKRGVRGGSVGDIVWGMKAVW